MTDKVVALRKATERPIRVAKMVAVGTAAVVVVGGVAIVVVGARHRAERKSLKKRMAAVGDAAASPGKTARQAVKALDRSLEETREKLRAELREELRKELQIDAKAEPSSRQKMLTAALRSAAGVAVPIIIKQLEQRMKASPNGKGATASATPAGSPKP